MIEIEQCDWGDADIADIRALLTNVAEHLNVLVDDPVAEQITVVAAPPARDYPMTHFRNPRGEGPITIQLAARDTYWAQFAYQFAHEFSHVLSNYERLEGNPNGWFHEALCELASVFALRRMASSWQTSPPWPHWGNYASKLADYANQLLAESGRQLPDELTIAKWLSNHENELRRDPYLRDKNAVVAYRLLPTFEAHPRGWNTVRNLPTSAGGLNDYLLDWYSQVDPKDRIFVGRIIEQFAEHPEDFWIRRQPPV